jgi:multidrug efflux system membrane fusion protein
MKTSNVIVAVSILIVLFAVGWFCFPALHSGGKTASSSQAYALPVTVKTLEKQKVQVWSEFSGRLRAVDSAEIRPEVSGLITKVCFKDGDYVKKGDVLFVIDQRPYEAAAQKAQADLATAETNQNFAKLELSRAEEMVKTQAIAQRLYDERQNAYNVTVAAVQSAQAQLIRANLDLEHSSVKAPIDGKTSRAELTEGNLVVSESSPPLMTTIVSNDSIYADFDVDEQTYLQCVRSAEENKSKGEATIPVQLLLPNDSGRAYQGTIDSFDNHIDIASGTIRARAKFKNEDAALVPGMFVSIKLASSYSNDALLVPEEAVGFDQDKKYVYLVNSQNKVQYREVVLGSQVGDSRIVVSGVQEGERVIVNGVQHVRPDAVVAPSEADVVDTARLADNKSTLKLYSAER